MSSDDRQIPLITDPDTDRYANLHLITWWDQEVIQRARVMVVGVGALGNEVLKNLALLGIGHILIVDVDTVAASNLTRSVLFRAEDSGKPKVEVAARRLRELNPDIQVIPIHGNIASDLGLGVYRRMDVIIGCLDNRAARVAVNQACQNVQRTWIDGALDVMGGLVRTFVPSDDVCYECTLSEQDYQLLNLHYSCPPGFAPVEGTQPTLPMNASIIAAMQVQEAIKLLYQQPVQAGQATYYIGETLGTFPMRYTHRPDCPAHGAYEPIISLPTGTHHMTVMTCMTSIREQVPEAEAIYLPQNLVKAFFCQHCETEEQVYRAYSEATLALALCSTCGQERTPLIIGSVSERGDAKDVPLAQLGIPALDILPVRTTSGWIYVELSGDEQRVLNAWLKETSNE